MFKRIRRALGRDNSSPKFVQIDMTGVSNDLPDEEKAEIFLQALKRAKKGIDTINPDATEDLIQIVNLVREEFGVNLDPINLAHQFRLQTILLHDFQRMFVTGGFKEVEKKFKVTEIESEGIKKYLMTFIDHTNLKFTCELELWQSPGIRDVPVLYNFRSSSYVATIDGYKVRLNIFNNKDGETDIDVAELEG